jgi:glycosyltransferase involved in cell wall biosynthesis
MSALKVLYVCHGHPDLQPGGGEIFAHDLFRAVRTGGQVTPMFVGCVSSLHRERRPGTEFQTLGHATDELLLWVGGFDRLMLGQTRALPFAAAFGDLLASFAPDIVHFHHLTMIGLEGLIMTRRLLPRARIVVTLHDYHLICANDGLLVSTHEDRTCGKPGDDACHRCFPRIERRHFAARRLHLHTLLSCVDRFVAPSRWLRERHVAWGLPAARIDVIGNGIPVTATAAPERPAASEPAARRVFGLFGNLAPHKGTLVALAAARLLAEAEVDCTLRLHGGLGFQTEPFRAAFATALADARPLAVHAGGYDRADLGRLLDAVDWVVVPSVWWENAPLVVLEAFRHGRPVICTDLGGLPELVRHQVNGLHVQPGDPLDLARAMRRAAREPGLWDRLVAGISPVPTIEDTAEQYLALYRRLLFRPEALSA